MTFARSIVFRGTSTWTVQREADGGYIAESPDFLIRLRSMSLEDLRGRIRQVLQLHMDGIARGDDENIQRFAERERWWVIRVERGLPGELAPRRPVAVNEVDIRLQMEPPGGWRTAS